MSKEELIQAILANADTACKAVYVGPTAVEQVAALVAFYGTLRDTLLAGGAEPRAVADAMPDLPSIEV